MEGQLSNTGNNKIKKPTVAPNFLGTQKIPNTGNNVKN